MTLITDDYICRKCLEEFTSQDEHDADIYCPVCGKDDVQLSCDYHGLRREHEQRQAQESFWAWEERIEKERGVITVPDYAPGFLMRRQA